MITKLLKLIPVRLLVKQLPVVLSFILTKVLQWSAKNHPEKMEKVIETTEEISNVLKVILKAGEDKIFDKEEIKLIAEAGKKIWQ